MLDERTRAELALEFQQLERLLSEYQPLLDEALAREPDLVKRTAIGAVLQSFYNGVEAVFLSIAKRIDQDVPSGETWHKGLLQQMGYATKNRGPVISQGMIERIEPYLGFRHISRHTYTFGLDWKKMRTLVTELSDVWAALHGEIRSHLDLDANEDS